MSASQPGPADPPAAAPTVRVRLFAALREAMGWSEQQVAAAANPATPLELWRQLDLAGAWLAATGAPAGATPAGEELPAGIRVAINQQFAEAHTPLAEGDELAFLPPISGG
ncbi:MAG: MoaD/ThiS family protein [Cyanobium sp. M30B3]|nr:MAG: MoaD/ThiS family protein [Cyanobium sp. M30B3]